MLGKELWGQPPAAAQGPRGGLDVWILETKFLLREVELAALTFDCECISLDPSALHVTLSLSASKSDPKGRGCTRSLACVGCAGRLPASLCIEAGGNTRVPAGCVFGFGSKRCLPFDRASWRTPLVRSQGGDGDRGAALRESSQASVLARS